MFVLMINPHTFGPRWSPAQSQATARLSCLGTDQSSAISTSAWWVDIKINGTICWKLLMVNVSGESILNHQTWGLNLSKHVGKMDIYDLVGGLEHFLLFHMLGMSSSQLTIWYFSEGLKPPTRKLLMVIVGKTMLNPPPVLTIHRWSMLIPKLVVYDWLFYPHYVKLY